MEFMNNHPIITLLMFIIAIDGIVKIVRALTDYKKQKTTKTTATEE